MRSQSSCESIPSIFQMSASMPAVLELHDRLAHQLGPQLGVVAVLVPADLLELVRLGRHQQLEQELAIVLVEPVGEPLQPLGLALVHLGVALGVVAHQHLGEVRVELLDVVAELVAVLEVELVLAGLLDRHREQQAALLGLVRDALGRAELLVHEAAGGVRVHALLGRLQQPLEDQVLRVRDRVGLLGRRVALDPEHLLLERPAVVEREDVELAAVAECHTSGYTLRAMEHRFSGPSYTLGIEEELMIVDEETLDLSNSIERLLADLSDVPTEGEVKPELMESVCEIATTPVRNTVEAGAQLRSLRRTVNQVAQQHGLAIGSAGTHPFALWEDQRIVARPRYRDLISGLQFVARQEIIFGIHVHVGVDHPDKAIHVTNGMRVHLPLLLALSGNSPFWRGDNTGLDSTRTPIFRAFPRVGIPPRYDDFEDWARRIEFMMQSKVIGDYTYLWYDVRPHPNFGTVEVRVMDSQTRVEHTLALAALVQAMVKELARALRRGQDSSRATRTRCSTRTSGWPPATGSARSWWTCRTRTACRCPS